MKNCLIAQSGGPTAVINASAMGLYEANREKKYFDKVFAGMNGIEGILNEDLFDLDTLTDAEVTLLKNSPSSGLGSCRYKLKDSTQHKAEYEKLFEVFRKNEIDAFFYIGGNDSQDTVKKLSAYAKENGIDVKINGIPKTIDNDLMVIDHTPGFGSAARYIATSTLESYLDSLVYSNNGIFITETMGRDTGWLAASASLARYHGRQCADFILLPEVAFDEAAFIEKVRKLFEEKGHVYIVVSEGVKYASGDFLAATSAQSHDSFGHAQLGGAGNAIKHIVMDNGITQRVKVLELSVLQRCAFHCVSSIDQTEAVTLGAKALELAVAGETGKVSILVREQGESYRVSYTSTEAANIANQIKYLPKEFISEDGFNVTEASQAYFAPLAGELPEYRVIHHFHSK